MNTNDNIIQVHQVPTLSAFVETLKEYQEFKSNIIQNDVIQDEIDEQVFFNEY